MIIPDHQKAASIILSKMDGSNSDMPAKSEESFGEPNEGLHVAAEELMHAIKDGSPQGVSAALRAFFTQCDPDRDESF